MNIILGGGISGLILLECLKDYVLISDSIGGQLKENFSLGPRIIHFSDKTKKFLNSIGIEEKEINFLVGYKDNYIVSNKVSVEQRIKYFNKTRPNAKFIDTCLSGGKNKIIGWDISDINLVETLYERNKDRIIQAEVNYINTENQEIYISRSNYKQVLKYTDLFSTLDLEILFRIIEEDSKLDLSKKEVYYSLIYSNDMPSWLENFSYVYDVSDENINRITYINKEYYVVESNTELILPYKNISGIKINSIKLKTQILNEYKMKEYKGIKLVGRYAQYNHSIKADNIIEEFFKGE